MTKTVWLVMVLGATACNPESARRAEQAAREVKAQRDDLERAQQKPHTPETVQEASELALAETEFDKRKALRIAVVRAEHEVIATQPMLISSMARHFPLTDAGRADVNEKLTAFQHRLDEAANLIQGLQNADASVWAQRDDDVLEAMKRLDDARAKAWQALDDAPKADPAAT